MRDYDCLPAALDYSDRQALDGLDDQSLRKLMRECEDWRGWMDGVRAGLETEAARTEWTALMQQETADVAEAHGRLADEAKARAQRSQPDSLIQPPENCAPGMSGIEPFAG